MWEQLDSYCLGSFAAALGGGWYYFDTHARQQRQLRAALVAIGSGMVTGLVVSVTTCYCLCSNERQLPLVVAIAASSGLIGWMPQHIVHIVRSWRAKPNGCSEDGLRFTDPGSDEIA